MNVPAPVSEATLVPTLTVAGGESGAGAAAVGCAPMLAADGAVVGAALAAVGGAGRVAGAEEQPAHRPRQSASAPPDFHIVASPSRRPATFRPPPTGVARIIGAAPEAVNLSWLVHQA